MLTTRTVTDLLDAFSSPDPTPGGGSASALAGALGASLFAMVAGMSKTKTGSPEARAALDDARVELLRLREALVHLVDRDAAAYELVVAAYKRPKITDAEKAARTAAIQEALKVATEVPIEILRNCAVALERGEVVAEHGNPSAKSDIGVGAQLLTTAIMGARFNIEINIGSLADPALVERLSSDVVAATRDFGGRVGRIFQSAGVFAMMLSGAARGAVIPHGPISRD